MRRKTRAELSRLLQQRNEYPDRAPQIDAEIRETFGETYAVMVMDMSGFSRLTIKHGIIHFLAMIHRMNQIAMPTVEEHDGAIIKFEADNAFAIFPDVEQAVEACVDIIKRLEAANTMLPDELDMHGKFGIGHGEVLIVQDEDLYGAEVNLASKLGEDLASRNEILLTEAAFNRADKDKRRYEKVEMSISGLHLVVYRVKL
jgi:adenylate cyclase